MNKECHLASTAQSVLRGWLIEHFINEQGNTHEYLLLTAAALPSSRIVVPTTCIVAAQWALLRGGSETLPDKEKKSEIDLMYAVRANKFLELLMMCRKTSVELCCDRSLVEGFAAKIASKLGIDFDPWEQEIRNVGPGEVILNTAVMTPEKCSDLRHYGSDDHLVETFRGVLWARRSDVVSFLKGCGIEPNALPPMWLVPSDDAKELPQGEPDCYLTRAPEFSGRGGAKRAIEWAWGTRFPSGIPAGMRSSQRNDELRKKIKELDERIPAPSDRTIQKVLQRLKPSS